MLKVSKPLLETIQDKTTGNNAKNGSIPFWFMRQAGRYLPEYRELRAQKGGFLEMAFDPKAACEITMQPIRRFGMDAAIIFSDILTIPMALGQGLEFKAGEGPVLGELDFSALKYNPEILNPVYEALGNVRTALVTEGFDKTALLGFSGAPWTVATYMVEGGSSRDFFKTKMMMYESPEDFSALIGMLVESTADYLISQIEAGAEGLQIFDSWAGALNAEEFENWCLKPIQSIVKIVKGRYPDVPIIGFPRGCGLQLVRFAKESGCDAVSLDQFTPTNWAADNIQPIVPVQGNLDPNLLLVGGKPLENAARRIISDFSDGPFVFNLGHGINKDTPVEHVERLVEILREG